jgi:hypothetical protein
VALVRRAALRECWPTLRENAQRIVLELCEALDRASEAGQTTLVLRLFRLLFSLDCAAHRAQTG